LAPHRVRDRWTFQIGLHARLIFEFVSAIAGVALIAPNDRGGQRIT
jgi:hypothetical protein